MCLSHAALLEYSTKGKSREPLGECPRRRSCSVRSSVIRSAQTRAFGASRYPSKTAPRPTAFSRPTAPQMQPGHTQWVVTILVLVDHQSLYFWCPIDHVLAALSALDLLAPFVQLYLPPVAFGLPPPPVLHCPLDGAGPCAVTFIFSPAFPQPLCPCPASVASAPPLPWCLSLCPPAFGYLGGYLSWWRATINGGRRPSGLFVPSIPPFGARHRAPPAPVGAPLVMLGVEWPGVGWWLPLPGNEKILLRLLGGVGGDASTLGSCGRVCVVPSRPAHGLPRHSMHRADVLVFPSHACGGTGSALGPLSAASSSFAPSIHPCRHPITHLTSPTPPSTTHAHRQGARPPAQSRRVSHAAAGEQTPLYSEETKDPRHHFPKKKSCRT